MTVAAAVFAIIAGLVALLGLTGKITVPRPWMRTMLAGLPVVAIAGATFGPNGWTLTTVIAMTVAVLAGMLASLIGPAELASPAGHWVAQAWRLTSVLLVGIVLGSAVIRWGSSIVAPMPLISPRDLALVLVVAAVAAAARGGSLRGLVSTGTVILLVLFVLVLLAGFGAGTPGTVAAPLMSVTQPTSTWLFLLVVFVLAASNPALRQIRAEGQSIVPGTIILAVVMLLGLAALLSFSGGYVTLPSFGFGTVAGYIGFASPALSALVGGLVVIVVLAAAVLAYRGVFTTHYSFRGGTAPVDHWWRSRWFVAVVIGVIALVTALYPIPQEPILWLAALFAVSGWVVAWWAGRQPDDADAEGIDPVAVGQGRSESPGH